MQQPLKFRSMIHRHYVISTSAMFILGPTQLQTPDGIYRLDSFPPPAWLYGSFTPQPRFPLLRPFPKQLQRTRGL